MMRTLKKWVLSASVVTLLAAGVAGCGSSDETKVYVMGDSLNDVGATGKKYTVQDSSNPKGFPIWTQILASHYGVDGSRQCTRYQSIGNSFELNTMSDCTNYAVGGGRIVVSAAQGGSSNPKTVGTQMAAFTGTYGLLDLVLIDGGGNDAADLVTKYLGAASDLAAYQTFLLQQLDATTVGALLPQPNGAALAAGAYMQQLANTFHGQITDRVLGKGAKRVVVLNMPDITLTPRFKMVLASVSAQAGAAAATALQGAIRQWIGAFNAQLASNFAGNSRVKVVDFYGELTNQVNNQATYGLTNAQDAVCPITGLGADGLPDYDFVQCTSAALDAQPGKTAGWWKTYSFSDGFHPTPRGHELMADTVKAAMSSAGWQ
jgi:outer membrane lipase/esterase